MSTRNDVVIVGAGLAGLAAAALAARGGKRVMILEKAGAPGGRAATHDEQGFRFNLGPHALYRHGAGVKVLRELGIEPRGAVPSSAGLYASAGGALTMLPVGFFSLLATGLLPLGAKLEVGRLLARLPAIDTAALERTTVDDWLETTGSSPEARAYLRAAIRVSTYANAPAEQSAGAALAQVQLALAGNVLYLDDGWGQLVTGLRAAAEAAGVVIRTSARVTAVERDTRGHAIGVSCADGTRHAAAAVLIAATPAVAASLLPGTSIERFAERAVPVRAACLDVALSALPRPRAKFALGIDAPTYVSVHSATAKLAPPGGGLIHVAKYLAPGDDASGAEAELEACLQLLQPGWREHVVHRRYLPQMMVVGALDRAADGAASRAPTAVPEVPGVYLAGDWVGREGMLSDASLASARTAARAILGVVAKERAAA